MNILITGASGSVATNLILRLLETTEDYLILVTRDKGKLNGRYEDYRDRIAVSTLGELEDDEEKQFDVCVHTAFSRSSNGKDVAESLYFTKNVCELAKQRRCAKFINLSSQSVYGGNYPSGITEDGICAPSCLYAMGKFSSELICDSILKETNTRLFNIRLASVMSNQRFVNIFVQNVISDKPIVVTAPRQVVSFIGARDVAEAISKMIFKNSAPSGVYNLGAGTWYSIEHVARKVIEVGKEFDIPNGVVEIEDTGKDVTIGMNCDKFKKEFDWIPRYGLESLIHRIFEELIASKSKSLGA